MRNGIIIDEKFCDTEYKGRKIFRVLLEQLIFLLDSVCFWGDCLCDRVQGVERFFTHLHHFPSQVPLIQLKLQKDATPF